MPYEFIARNGLIAQNDSIITGSLTVTGTITATTLVAQTITSSTSWITGSTKFGTTLNNTHQFTGSVSITGSLSVNGISPIYANQTASMTVGTSSYPVNAYGDTLYTPISGDYSNLGDNDRTIVFGYEAGAGRGYFYEDTLIGYQAGYNTNFGSYYLTLLGAYAGAETSGSVGLLSLGSYAGAYSKELDYTNAIGFEAGYTGVNLRYSNIIGSSAGNGATQSFNTNMIGYSAGNTSKFSDYSNFIGSSAGAYSISSSYSNLIGYNVGYSSTLGRNNIIIGSSITLPTNTRDSINIGGLIFGTGSYFNAGVISSGSANGKIGINQPSPQYSFDVSGSGRYTNGLIVSDGNVGIGTTTPAYKLDVNGTANISGVTNLLSSVNIGSAGSVIINAGSAATPLIKQTANYTELYKQGGGVAIYLGGSGDPANYYDNTTHNFRSIGGGTTYVVIISSGNVGIGTTSPSYKAEVAGAIGNYWNGSAFTGTPLALAISNTTAGGYDPVLIFQQTDSGGTTKNAGGIGLVGTGAWTAGNNANQVSDMYFLVRNNSGGISERMRIKSDGNVGIGTTSPEYMLDILTNKTGNGAGSSVRLNRPNSGSYENAINWATNGTNKWFLGNDNDSTDNFYLYNWARGAFEITVLSSGGNVGIGSTSPAYKLDVSGSIAMNGRLFAFNSATYTQITDPAGGIKLYLGASDDPGNYYDNTSHNFRSAGGGTNYVTINSNGNVGIGSTSPSVKLDVAGAGLFSSSVTAQNIYSISDNSEQIVIKTSSDNNKQLIFGRTSTDARIIAVTQGVGYAPLLLNPSGGNVGIGTTSVTENLKVYAAAARLSVTGPSGASAILMGNQDSAGVNNPAVIYSANGSLYFGGGDSWSGGGTFDTSMIIADGGNVGIGTTSPSVKLDVNGIIVSSGSNPNRPVTIDNGVITKGESGGWAMVYGFRGGSNTYRGGFGVLGGNDAITYYWIGGAYDDAAMYITSGSGGNVGMGTTSPSYKLDVAGTSRSDLHIFRSNQSAPTADAFIFRPADNTVALGTANTERLRINASGNVGIGTTTPGYKLDVQGGDINFSGALRFGGVLVLYNSSTDVYANIRVLRSESTYNDGMYIGYDGTGGTSAHLRFYANGTNERMRIDASSGNVGIGSTSPAYKLDVNGTGRFQDNLFIKTTLDYGSLNVIGYDNSGINIIDQRTAGSGEFYSSITFRDYYLSNSAAINFYHNQYFGSGANRLSFSFLGSEKLSILYGGNVGIGTTSPGSKVSVLAAGGTAFDIDFRNNNAVYEVITLGAKLTADTNWSLSAIYGGRSADGSSYLSFQTGTGGTNSEKMRITSDGNVGIGTTSPLQKLHVVGNVYIDDDDGTGNGVILGTGDRPLITRGWDPFTSGNKNGVGRWGVYMESAELFVGTPGTDYGNGLVTIGGWLLNGTRQPNLTVNNYTRNVGIGTTSPANKLEVNAGGTVGYSGNDIVFRNSNGQSALYHDAGGYVYWYSTQAITFYPGQSRSVTFATNGYVGIGTTSPLARLHVTGNILSYTEATNTASLFISANNSYNWQFGIGNNSNFVITEGGGLNAIGTTRFSILPGGNVGIGTTTPTSKLQVSGSTNVVNIVGSGSAATSSIFSVDGNNGRLFEITDDLSDSIFSANTIAGLPVIEAFSDYTVRLGTYNGASGSTVNITGSNVGIGIVNPDSKLMIANANSSFYRFGYAGTSDVYIDTNNMYFRTATGGSNTVTINSSGNVGIGTTNPLTKIEVYNSSEDRHFSAIGTSPSLNLYSSNTSPVYGGTMGLATSTNAYLQGSAVGDLCILTRGSYSSGIILFGSGSTINASISTAGTITARGDMIAYGTPSDISFKTNIVPIQGSLDIIQKLEPVSFTWKEDTESNKLTNIKDDLGFIAQQVQEVLPELVRENDNGTLSLRERGIIPLLVGAIKELKAEIDILKNK